MKRLKRPKIFVKLSSNPYFSLSDFIFTHLEMWRIKLQRIRGYVDPDVKELIKSRHPSAQVVCPLSLRGAECDKQSMNEFIFGSD